MKKAPLLLAALVLLGSMPAAVGAQGPALTPGQLIKSRSSSAVYYLDEDLGRQVFPNARIFASWYANFDGVVEVDDATLSEYPLTGNVPYKPAKRLVKLQTDPKVYAVDEGGTLRWLKSEAVARALYGPGWNRLIDDLSDAFFIDYAFGDDVDDEDEFESEGERHGLSLIKTLRVKRLNKLSKRGASSDDLENDGFGKNKVAVCHKFGTSGAHTIFIAKPALPAHLAHGDKEGRCAGDETPGDTTAPVILTSSIGSVTLTSARLLFTANESVTAAVHVSTSTPVVTSGTATVVVTAASNTHDVALTGLASGTTYRVKFVVADAAGNKTTSSELTFTTLSPDTTAPTFLTSSIGSATTTSAHVLFTTDEPVTAAVHVSTSTPVVTSGTATTTVTTLAASHDVLVSGLVAGTTYHVVVIVTDAAGNVRTSSELTFTTASGS